MNRSRQAEAQSPSNRTGMACSLRMIARLAAANPSPPALVMLISVMSSKLSGKRPISRPFMTPQMVRVEPEIEIIASASREQLAPARGSLNRCASRLEQPASISDTAMLRSQKELFEILTKDTSDAK